MGREIRGKIQTKKQKEEAIKMYENLFFTYKDTIFKRIGIERNEKTGVWYETIKNVEKKKYSVMKWSELQEILNKPEVLIGKQQ